MKQILVMTVAFTFQFQLWASATQFESGERQLALIELYSSEGCSSCPPADRWMNGLLQSAKLWQEFIPLNFHVDYWNQLGWNDRFSNKLFSRRQREWAKNWPHPRVYTPAFIKNGKEWRSRQMNQLLGQPVGNLKASVQGEVIKVTFDPMQKQPSELMVHVALLGHGLKTSVESGENAGETLSHEFVVLNMKNYTLKKEGLNHQAIAPLPKTNNKDVLKTSLAIWVTEKGKMSPIQATGGPLPVTQGR